MPSKNAAHSSPGASWAQLGGRHLVVGLVPVAPLGARPVAARQLQLQLPDLLGARAGILVPGQGRQLGDVVPVRLPVRLHPGIVGQVIVAIGQAQPGLIQVEDVLGRLLAVLVHPRGQQRAQPQPLLPADLAGDLALAGQLADALEVGLQRAQPQLVRRRLVQERPIEIGDLLPLGTGLLLHGRQLIDQRADVRAGVVVQLREHRVVGLVRGDRRGLQPAAVDVAVEVVLRPHLLVEPPPIQTGGQRGPRTGRRRRARACRPGARQAEQHQCVWVPDHGGRD